MKRFLLWFLCSAAFMLAAGTSGDYLFKLNIDEPLRDLSGHERHPLNSFAESDFYRGDREGILFRHPDAVLKLPVSAFSLPQGAVEITFRAADADAPQTLMLYYSDRDNFLIQLNKGRLRAAFYHRAAKQWYSCAGRGLKVRKERWYTIRAVYQFPGKIALYADGKLIGEGPADAPCDAGKKAVLLLGNNQAGTALFRSGVLHRAVFFDCAEAPQKGSAASRKREAAFAMSVGGFEMTWEQTGQGGLSLLGMKTAGTEYLSPLRCEPIWKIRLYDSGTKQYTVLDSLGSAGTAGKNEIVWEKVPLPDGGSFRVTLKLAPVKGGGVDWQLETGELPAPWAVDNAVYPILALAPTSSDPRAMHLAFPAYCGRCTPDPFTFGKPRSGTRFGNAYGGGAHFQFCFLYSLERPGLYLATPDAEGCLKEYTFTAFPEDKALVFTPTHFPEQRALSRSFSAPYPVRTVSLKGDWYDAAKRYRKWAVRQKWCSQGTLEKRTDLPAWLHNCDMSTRPWMKPNCHKEKIRRQILDSVLANCTFLNVTFPTEFLNVWYSYRRDFVPEPRTAGSLKYPDGSNFNGHWNVEFVPGVPELLPKLAALRFHTIGYINSIIYDQSLDPADAGSRAMLPYVTRNLDGSLFLYNNLLYYCCRGAKGWQDQLLKIIRRDAKALGFAGMYLDSFGRGYNFCYAENHGHKLGSRCASVQGQLKMAEYLKREMRKEIPGFVLGSEANIEQFAGVIDIKLHHYNIHTGSVPIGAAIYHDYQLVYGRVATLPEVNTTAIFHMGGILGRYFTDRDQFSEIYFPQERIVEYTKQLVSLRQKYRRRIGTGEMLRPPEITCGEPLRHVTEKKMSFDVPAIQGSAWKDPDGGVSLFFTNSTEKQLTFSFDLKGAEFDPYRKNIWKTVTPRNGSFEELPYRTGSPITLPPLSAVAVDLEK